MEERRRRSASEALCRAAYDGDEEAVRRMLEHSDHVIDINSGGMLPYTPLTAACDMGHQRIVQLLLTFGQGLGLNVNVKDAMGRTPLERAEQRQDITEMLLRAGARDASGTKKIDSLMNVSVLASKHKLRLLKTVCKLIGVQVRASKHTA
jgi:ankyrin repeat protein